jgi:hypothetical protein
VQTEGGLHCVFFQEKYMKQTRFEAEHIQAKFPAAPSSHPEITGSETDNLDSDTKRKTLDNGTKAVESVAWMKMLGLIR